MNDSSRDNFAETSETAWRRPGGFSSNARALLRRQVLRMARLSHPSGPANFIRCLFSHAVFPDSKQDFETVICKLKNVGDFIDTHMLIEMMESGKQPKGKFFHLSFDDGFANVYEEGGEVLQRHGVPYTMFLTTDLINAPWENIRRINNARLNYALPVRPMTWNQVRESIRGGAEIGCHTRNHPRLSGISSDTDSLHDEIANAKAKIEMETGVACQSFAWPFGKSRDIDDLAVSKIAQCGFRINFSAVRGRVIPGRTSLMRVPRHQLEFHWPQWENFLWARGYRE